MLIKRSFLAGYKVGKEKPTPSANGSGFFLSLKNDINQNVLFNLLLYEFDLIDSSHRHY